MTKARLLSTAALVAAFSVAGAITAVAQTQPKPEPAPAAQQHAPAEKVAPSIHAGERKAPMAHETTGQATKEPAPGHVQAGEGSKTEMKAGPAHAGAVEHSNTAVKGQIEQKSSSDMSKDTSKDAAAKPSASEKSATTGQGAAAASAKLSTEQRSKISAIVKKQNVKPVHVNFSINIGTRVPPTVHYYPLPTEVVTIYPEWRGYDYILVGDQIVVIDPDTHAIVAVIEA